MKVVCGPLQYRNCFFRLSTNIFLLIAVWRIVLLYFFLLSLQNRKHLNATTNVVQRKNSSSTGGGAIPVQSALEHSHSAQSGARRGEAKLSRSGNGCADGADNCSGGKVAGSGSAAVLLQLLGRLVALL